MFAMTSFGAKVDESVNVRPGPYVFKVSGQICHHIGSFCASPGERPRFLQMYIYDTEREVSNHLRFFGEQGASSLNANVVALLVSILDDVNELVKLFRSAGDLCLSGTVPTFSLRLYSDMPDKRYQPPSAGCIGAIVYEDQPKASDFDIIVRMKDDVPQRVSKLHHLYMPLQYPLLFVYGDHDWGPRLRLIDRCSSCGKQLTMSMYYSYRIHDRLNTYTHILRGGRLFQQYLVDAYICIEQNRLEYIRSHQDSLRSEYLQGIHDALARGYTSCNEIGKRTILPSTFTRGPRYMYKHYQDALAICRVHGNPQYFLIFTCNVKWPEIARCLTQTTFVKPQDRHDIIARVFQLKVECFMKYLRFEKPFGEVAADLYTIEFQKRGLPHCHTLLWVKAPYKINTAAEVDNYISAQIPNPATESILNRIVTELMLNGPCGLPKPRVPCMVNNVCSKHFPKPFEHETRFDKNGYVHYKRRPDSFSVVKGGVTMDDAYVVPYNPKPLLRFDAHINVEYCGWNMVIKYLFKYISKGVDRVRFTILSKQQPLAESSQPCVPPVDVIKNFVDGQFICPHESARRIFEFPIHCRNPAVQVLAVHLENMQNVSFRGSQQPENVVASPNARQTTLTEWLRNNRFDVERKGTHLRYIDYVSEYRWDTGGRCWVRRTSNKVTAIGHLIYIHPSSGETFYLRMLLAHQSGCKSFADIRTIDGKVFTTYQCACQALGLLNNDDEWSEAFIEASAWATSKELRALFTHMLLFCEV